jgi:cell division FtsZ-interacting protein ZapD
MMQNQVHEEGLDDLRGVKDEILEVLNQLRGISEELQKGLEVSNEKVNTLIGRGETLAKRIGSLAGMEQAGEEFLVHIHKIGQAIRDLKNFDALKKENLVTGVKF